MKNAYLRTYHEKYAVDFGVDHGSGGNPVDDRISAINQAYEITKEYDLSAMLLGIDWEKTGRRCSIAVCAMVVGYVLYKVVDWAVKVLMILGSGDTTVVTGMLMACCTQVHLLAKTIQEQRGEAERGEEHEMNNINQDEDSNNV